MKMEGDRASRLLGPKRCSGRPWWSRRLCYAVHVRPNAVKEATTAGAVKGRPMWPASAWVWDRACVYVCVEEQSCGTERSATPPPILGLAPPSTRPGEDGHLRHKHVWSGAGWCAEWRGGARWCGARSIGKSQGEEEAACGAARSVPDGVRPGVGEPEEKSGGVWSGAGDVWRGGVVDGKGHGAQGWAIARRGTGHQNLRLGVRGAGTGVCRR